MSAHDVVFVQSPLNVIIPTAGIFGFAEEHKKWTTEIIFRGPFP
jgi:hypothetical protein